MSDTRVGGEYAVIREAARAKDGDESTRSAHLAATIEYLKARDLMGVTVEDDGVRVLVHVGQRRRGRPATEWLAEVVAP
jgi:hypothetical protein